MGNNLLISRGAFPVRMKRETAKANLDKAFELLHTPVDNTLF